MNTTTWRPDTCNCVIEYEWDPAVPQDARVHTARSAKPCAVHATIQALSGHVGTHAAVLDENQRKNKVVGAARETNPTLTDDDVAWSFDAQRVLHVSLRGLPRQALNALQAKADTAHGVGKVKFD